MSNGKRRVQWLPRLVIRVLGYGRGWYIVLQAPSSKVVNQRVYLRQCRISLLARDSDEADAQRNGIHVVRRAVAALDGLRSAKLDLSVDPGIVVRWARSTTIQYHGMIADIRPTPLHVPTADGLDIAPGGGGLMDNDCTRERMRALMAANPEQDSKP